MNSSKLLAVKAILMLYWNEMVSHSSPLAHKRARISSENTLLRKMLNQHDVMWYWQQQQLVVCEALKPSLLCKNSVVKECAKWIMLIVVLILVASIILLIAAICHLLGPRTISWFSSSGEEKIGLSKSKLYNANGYIVSRRLQWYISIK